MHQVPKGKIARVEKSILRGTRPRSIGYNARLPTHGSKISDAIVRLHTADGAWGLGWSQITADSARDLLGREIDELFSSYLRQGRRPVTKNHPA